MPCPMCAARTDAADARCGFDVQDRAFTPRNRDCATLSVLRDRSARVFLPNDEHVGVVSINGAGDLVLLRWLGDGRTLAQALYWQAQYGDTSPLQLHHAIEALEHSA